jgi:hypothetical protein
MAHTFVHVFIAESTSDDQILPKNGKFSPFHGFCRMMSQHANVKDGGTSVDGVSRAGLNKLLGTYFLEGMRKPSRNGNPGDLDSPCASKLARHFLKVRWRDPDEPKDCMVLQKMFSIMQPNEVQSCIAVLREFTKWRPGPAGRGGRANVRTASDAGTDPVDAVLRTVRQRIEKASPPSGHCAASVDDGTDEDDCDDDMSMRSTVVNAPAATRPSLPHPVDKVQAMQSLIDDIRRRTLGGSCAPTAATISASGGARSLHAWTSSAGNTVVSPSVAGASSADLLESIFRQVASQQLNKAASQPLSGFLSLLVAQPSSHRPLFLCGVNDVAKVALATQAAHVHAELGVPSLPQRHLVSKPPLESISNRGSPEEAVVGSCFRIQQLCAVIAAAGAGDASESAPSLKMQSHVPDLTLPPLRHVLYNVIHD